ncbi:MAG: SIR2 family protein [Rhodospirillales bacterium]|nr:SIR2 family protein [Rhodospirillales bacterium]
MPEHDPLRFATELSAKLATRSRHVCVFLGAGAARACGLPDISQLRDRVLARLEADERAALTTQLTGRNLEEALSRLRRIAALVAGDQTVDGLTGDQAKALDAVVCQAIVKELDIAGADLAPVCRLAAWVAHAGYRLPIEIFTVNYDLLLETALERLRVLYFDGFVGTLRARFHIELVENVPGLDAESVPAFFVRLWKLHGSVNWAWQDDQQIVRLGQPVAEGAAAAIYPSDAKYEESRRVPFVVLQDRLRRALHQPETLVLIAGYSFNDAHLNELLFDAAARRERSEFIVFCYSAIPEVLANRAGTIPNLQVVSGEDAILGGVRGTWKVPEDAPPGLWEEGRLALRDFGKLAAYLARSAAREPETDQLLKGLIKEAVARDDSKVDGDRNG